MSGVRIEPATYVGQGTTPTYRAPLSIKDKIKNMYRKISFLFTVNYTFILLNILIIIGSITGFIYGQFDFKYNFVISGTFIGGHLTQISFVTLIFGILGLYSVIRENSTTLMVYCSLSMISLFIRNFTNGLANLHGYVLIYAQVFGGLYLFFELFSLILSFVILLRDKNKNENYNINQ
jgi:hypothetical protein